MQSTCGNQREHSQTDYYQKNKTVIMKEDGLFPS